MAKRSSRPSSTWGLEAGAAAGAVEDLCADLVVPEGAECTLLVPWMSAAAPDDISIVDMRGTPVFRAVLAQEGSKRRITLSNASRSVVFASCVGGTGTTGDFTIMSSDRRKYGVLAFESRSPGGGSSYSVAMDADWQLKFRSFPYRSGVNVYDMDMRMLAVAQPESPGERYHRVRVGPLVDAGLVVISLLGVDVLDQERAGTQRDPSADAGNPSEG